MGAPAVPNRPSARHSTDSCARSRSRSTPATDTVQAGSGSITGRRPSGAAPVGPRGARRMPTARRESERRRAARLPAPVRRTRRSRPMPRNDHERVAALEVAKWRKFVTNHEHEARADPRSDSARNAHCARSALSVSPISTCFASDVIFGSRKPGVLCSFKGDCRRSRERPDACTSQTAFDSSEQLGEPSFGGSAHAGSGIRSIFRLFRATRDNPCHESTGTQPIDRQLGRTVQQPLPQGLPRGGRQGGCRCGRLRTPPNRD